MQQFFKTWYSGVLPTVVTHKCCDARRIYVLRRS